MFISFLLYLYGILILFYHTVCKRLDKSFYLNKEDFEVEYEVTDQIHTNYPSVNIMNIPKVGK